MKYHIIGLGCILMSHFLWSQDRITGDYNDFWAGRDFQNELDGIKAELAKYKLEKK